MRSSKPLALAIAALALAACAQQPLGPMVRVMPGPNKPFEVFRADQDECRDYASSEVAGADRDANNRAVGATALGAALGLAVGAAAGNGRTAVEGAAIGGTAGAAIGTSESQRESYGIQRRYDIAYSECMASKGNQVPGFGGPRRGRGPGPGYDAPPPPPPPPGR